MASAPGVTRKILIAMDGSKFSGYAFDWYLKTFQRDKDDVIIVYCAEHGTLVSAQIPSNDPATIARLAGEEEGEIATLVSTLEKKVTAAGIKGTVMRLSGNKPGELIVKASQDHNADIIITGCRGKGQLRRTLMGSVSTYVVHHADIPVLVVRMP